jgi:hypothetical protein
MFTAVVFGEHKSWTLLAGQFPDWRLFAYIPGPKRGTWGTR